ncbi:hypothetical protein [Streptomyces endophyticus]|uniref:Uncharacterized protein n=1 Tax=Streptomyces endophyticus TaxID=714166 RepID=A0ABU6F2T7_9ACTN|nr:hypothetical protein [Streptomyces endophyticus]MEB8338320.1 hypothetical protein [Streptomyces endophyticus]
MSTHSWTRRSYEADVLLVPLDPTARASLSALRDELPGITVAEERPPADVLPQDVERADVITLLVRDLAAVDHATVARFGEAAHATGTLLGAVVVTPGLAWSGGKENAAAAMVREHADTVVVVPDMPPVLHLLQVLRGGSRDTAEVPA